VVLLTYFISDTGLCIDDVMQKPSAYKAARECNVFLTPFLPYRHLLNLRRTVAVDPSLRRNISMGCRQETVELGKVVDAHVLIDFRWFCIILIRRINRV